MDIEPAEPRDSTIFGHSPKMDVNVFGPKTSSTEVEGFAQCCQIVQIRHTSRPATVLRANTGDALVAAGTCRSKPSAGEEREANNATRFAHRATNNISSSTGRGVGTRRSTASPRRRFRCTRRRAPCSSASWLLRWHVTSAVSKVWPGPGNKRSTRPRARNDIRPLSGQ